MSQHIRCPEEVDTGYCSRSGCPYRHSQQAAFQPSSYVAPIHMPYSAPSNEQYNPAEPLFRLQQTNHPVDFTQPPQQQTSTSSVLGTVTLDSNTLNVLTSFLSLQQLAGNINQSSQPAFASQPQQTQPYVPLTENYQSTTPSRTSETPSAKAISQKPTKTIAKPVRRGVSDSIMKSIGVGRVLDKNKALKKVVTPEKKAPVDILDTIPKAERPTIPFMLRTYAPAVHRRPMMEHFLRFFMQNLQEGEDYKVAIKKATEIEQQIYFDNLDLSGYKAGCNIKFAEVKKTYLKKPDAA